LNLARPVISLSTSGQDISTFLNNLKCSDGGKHAYFRTLMAFYNWLYSPKSGYGLDPRKNPILLVDPPKVGKRILSSLSQEQERTRGQ